MSLNNTSDRYNYIFGNTVRKLEVPVQKPGRKPAGQKDTSVRRAAGRRTVLESPFMPAKRARIRRREEHALDFDWKYTVIVTLAAFIFMACAIFYVKGTVTLHTLSGQVTELKEEKTKLLGKQTALQSEIDKAANLDEIRTYAVKKLGMVSPDQNHVIYYKDSFNDYIRQYESVNTGR